jgi:anti-sigma-K factor RskA
MNTTRHIEQDELALFAMQLLSSDEAAAMSRHLEQCGDCRRELAAIQGDLAVYAHTVDLHSPPAQARERLMKQVAREKKITPITQTATHSASRSASRSTFGDLSGSPSASSSVSAGAQAGSESSYLRTAYAEDAVEERSFASKALPWVGWAVAAGLAVTTFNFYHERNSLKAAVDSEASQLAHLSAETAAARQVLDTMNDSSALRVTLQKPLTAPVPQARATYVADKGSLLFQASNMEPLLPYKVYELWLIPADGRDPIPAGTFRPDQHGNASVILPPLPKGVEAKVFGVTIEDEGGSTTPTLPIILAGTPA